MAINPAVRYPANSTPPDAAYPFGSGKNSTAPGAKNGYPWEKDQINDWQGFFQGLLTRSSITPSGSPDTVLVSDYLDGLAIQIVTQAGATHASIASMVADVKLQSTQSIRTQDYKAGTRGGGGDYLIKTNAQATTDGDDIDQLINHTIVGGLLVAILQFDNELIVTQAGIINDGLEGLPTNNTPAYQNILDKARIQKNFNKITFPDGNFYFEAAAGKTTCVFLSVDAEDFQENPYPLAIGGSGTIIIDNSTANVVWMSGPDDSTGAVPANVATAIHIDGGKTLTITSSDIDRPTFDTPFTTMPNFGIGFNFSRVWRSSIKNVNFEFVKGIVQAPSSDALYDSSNSFVQQLIISGNVSTHHQENFIEFSQAWSTDILWNTIERGNGGIDVQRSSGQSFFRGKIVGNTIQSNGITEPLKINFGAAVTIEGNYFESNRVSSGVAQTQVKMSANGIDDPQSGSFKNNLFSQSSTNLDGVGSAYAHVELDGYNNFYPEGNAIIGGNGYKMTNSTGKVFSKQESYETQGSAQPEGEITTGGTISGVFVAGDIYTDPVHNVPRVDAAKRGDGNLGFLNMESINIPDGTARTFKKSARGIFSLTARFTDESQGIFTAGDAGVAPKSMAAPAGTLFDFSATPSVPGGGRIDVAVNASSDGITVYNNLGSDRDFALCTLAAVDWPV